MIFSILYSRKEPNSLRIRLPSFCPWSDFSYLSHSKIAELKIRDKMVKKKATNLNKVTVSQCRLSSRHTSRHNGPGLWARRDGPHDGCHRRHPSRRVDLTAVGWVRIIAGLVWNSFSNHTKCKPTDGLYLRGRPHAVQCIAGAVTSFGPMHSPNWQHRFNKDTATLLKLKFHWDQFPRNFPVANVTGKSPTSYEEVTRKLATFRPSTCQDGLATSPTSS